jgi:hypothetical protein
METKKVFQPASLFALASNKVLRSIIRDTLPVSLNLKEEKESMELNMEDTLKEKQTVISHFKIKVFFEEDTAKIHQLEIPLSIKENLISFMKTRGRENHIKIIAQKTCGEFMFPPILFNKLEKLFLEFFEKVANAREILLQYTEYEGFQLGLLTYENGEVSEQTINIVTRVLRVKEMNQDLNYLCLWREEKK